MNNLRCNVKENLQSKTLNSMLKNVCIRPISIIIGLIYTPILLDYLGETKYGIWMTILSIITWVNFADIGIGNGARNMVSAELSNQEYDKVKSTISTAYMMLSGISFVLIILLLIASFLIDWNGLLNTEEDLTVVMAICFTGIAINFVLGLGKAFLYALQLSEHVSAITLFTSILQLIGIIALNRFSKGNLVFLSIIFGMSSAVVYLSNDLYLSQKYKYFCFDIKAFDHSKVRFLCGSGIMFLVLQIGGIVMYSTDNVLVSNIYGPDSVTPYSSVYRFFSTIISVYVAFITPVWSRSTVAIEHQDYRWISKTFKSLNYLMLLLSASLIIIAPFFRSIAMIWLRRDLNYYPGLILITAICTISEMYLMTYSTMLNGMNMLKIQVYIAVFQSVLNIPFSYLLATVGGLNVIGIKLATLILMTVGAIVYAREIVKEIKKMKENVS